MNTTFDDNAVIAGDSFTFRNKIRVPPTTGDSCQLAVQIHCQYCAGDKQRWPLALALLAAMLLPTIKMVRESANSVACLSILRQMGLANQCYANEGEGRYVAVMYFDGAGNPNWNSDQWYNNVRFLSFLMEDEAQRNSDAKNFRED